MRVAIGGLLHESNTFNPARTDLRSFRVERGQALVPSWQGTHHEMGGFIDGASREGFEIFPLLLAEAVPSGIVTRPAFETITLELINRLSDSPPLDGLLLALHGAMVAEDFSAADGETLRRIRQSVGENFPIVVTHDFHANVSEQIVAGSDALVIYQTNPHLDQFQRGLLAAGLIARIIRGEVRPVQALFKPPLLFNIVHQNTQVEPLLPVMQAARDSERLPGVLAANVAAGYQYADVKHMGPAVVVAADGDRELAESEALRLANLLWELRDRLEIDLPDAAKAVSRALESEMTPVVLVDMGDNIGGGSAGDGTIILNELIRQRAAGWMVVLADPEAVKKCARAGVGMRVDLRVGGKKDNLHGDPVAISGRVKCIHDGRFIETEPRHGGHRFHDQGTTTVLEIDAGDPGHPGFLVLTTHRQTPFSLQQLLSLGIQPERQRILVVKAAIAYRAAYEPIAGRIIEVDTPGLTAVNPDRFVYHNVRRPFWGLDSQQNDWKDVRLREIP